MDTGILFCKGIEHRNPALFCLAGSRFGGIEREFPHAEDRHFLSQHGAKINSKILCCRVIRTDDKQFFFGRFCKSRRKICPVDSRKPGNKRRKPAAFPQTGEGGGFLVIQNLSEQDIHRRGLYHFKEKVATKLSS